jgi:hypothetical protein
MGAISAPLTVPTPFMGMATALPGQRVLGMLLLFQMAESFVCRYVSQTRIASVD